MSEFDKSKEGLRSVVSATPEELEAMKRNERKAWRKYGRAEAREERQHARAQARLERRKARASG